MIAIDRLHAQIINSTSQTYYYRISRWPTEQLVCGFGRHEQDLQDGPIAATETVEFSESSTPDTPVTVAIWDEPCGEGGCDGPPMGLYVVPISTVEPSPISS